MTTSEIIIYIVIPLSLFILASLGTGVTMLVKITVYFAKSREAQEATAKSTAEVASQLKAFITSASERLNDHGERLAVVEDRTGVRK